MKKHPHTERRRQRWAFMHFHRVPDMHNRGIFFNRLRIVQTPWFGVYLHKLIQPDVDRHLHNHPWNFISLILWRSYTETISATGEWSKDGLSSYDRSREVCRGLFSIHRHPLSRYHAIRHMPKPVWTLLIVGRRLQDWGYLTEAGWIDHNLYHTRRAREWSNNRAMIRHPANVQAAQKNDAQRVD